MSNPGHFFSVVTGYLPSVAVRYQIQITSGLLSHPSRTYFLKDLNWVL